MFSTGTTVSTSLPLTLQETQTSASFQLNTVPVAANETVTISAAAGGATVTSSVTVLAPTLSALAITATTLDPQGGTATTIGTATLTGEAPASSSIILTSGNTGAATVSTTLVPITTGATSVSFVVQGNLFIGADQSANIQATLSIGGQTGTPRAVQMTIKGGVGLSTMTVTPTSVATGATATGTVTLSGPARAPIGVSLVSSNTAAATVPTTPVTVPTGSSSTTFTVQGLSFVGASKTTTISASYLNQGPPGVVVTVAGTSTKNVTKENKESADGPKKSPGQMEMLPGGFPVDLWEFPSREPAQLTVATGRAFIQPGERPSVGSQVMSAAQPPPAGGVTT